MLSPLLKAYIKQANTTDYLDILSGATGFIPTVHKTTWLHRTPGSKQVSFHDGRALIDMVVVMNKLPTNKDAITAVSDYLKSQGIQPNMALEFLNLLNMNMTDKNIQYMAYGLATNVPKLRTDVSNLLQELLQKVPALATLKVVRLEQYGNIITILTPAEQAILRGFYKDYQAMLLTALKPARTVDIKAGW